MATPFRDRLKQAATYAKVGYSQTEIARALGLERKQTVDRWMGDGTPTPQMIFHIADVWRVDARWLATGEGEMIPRAGSSDLSQQEEDLVARFRSADPRWQLSLRLLAALASEDQIEAATDVNMVIARILGKKPAEVRYASNERVAAAFGPAPHTVQQTKAKYRSGK